MIKRWARLTSAGRSRGWKIEMLHREQDSHGNALSFLVGEETTAWALTERGARRRAARMVRRRVRADLRKLQTVVIEVGTDGEIRTVPGA